MHVRMYAQAEKQFSSQGVQHTHTSVEWKGPTLMNSYLSSVQFSLAQGGPRLDVDDECRVVMNSTRTSSLLGQRKREGEAGGGITDNSVHIHITKIEVASYTGLPMFSTFKAWL